MKLPHDPLHENMSEECGFQFNMLNHVILTNEEKNLFFVSILAQKGGWKYMIDSRKIDRTDRFQRICQSCQCFKEFY